MSNLRRLWSGFSKIWAMKYGRSSYKLDGFVNFTPCCSSNIHVPLVPGTSSQSESKMLCAQQAGVIIFLEALPHTRMAHTNWTAQGSDCQPRVTFSYTKTQCIPDLISPLARSQKCLQSCRGKLDREEVRVETDNGLNQLLLKYVCKFYGNRLPHVHIARAPPRGLEGSECYEKKKKYSRARERGGCGGRHTKQVIRVGLQERKDLSEDWEVRKLAKQMAGRRALRAEGATRARKLRQECA